MPGLVMDEEIVGVKGEVSWLNKELRFVLEDFGYFNEMMNSGTLLHLVRNNRVPFMCVRPANKDVSKPSDQAMVR